MKERTWGITAQAANPISICHMRTVSCDACLLQVCAGSAGCGWGGVEAGWLAVLLPEKSSPAGLSRSTTRAKRSQREAKAS